MASFFNRIFIKNWKVIGIVVSGIATAGIFLDMFNDFKKKYEVNRAEVRSKLGLKPETEDQVKNRSFI